MGILFFILKLIGKILLIILLLLLLIILLVLFVPFRYRIDINKEGRSGGGTATVSWLLRMVQVVVGADLSLDTGFKVIKDVKLFGVSLFSLLGKMKGGGKAPEPGPAAADTAAAGEPSSETAASAIEAAVPEEESPATETAVPGGETPAPETSFEAQAEAGPQEMEAGGDAEAAESEADGGSEESTAPPEAEPAEGSGEGTAPPEAEPQQETAEPKPPAEPKTNPMDVVRVLGRQALAFLRSIPARIIGFTFTSTYRIMELLVRLILLVGTVIWQAFGLVFRLFGLPGEIETIRAAVFDKFWQVVRLIQKWTAFATDAQVHEAVGFLLDRVRKLLGHVMPKKLRGHIELGFEDPSVTGNVMAAYAAVYPLYLNDFELTPYFNETRFEGKADIQGRIYLFYVAYIAVTTILNKNIKYVISYLKHMKEEDS